MAPRKDANMPAPSPAQTQQDASSEGIESFELPKLLVTQLAKSCLPRNVKIENDSITALIKGSTVFINYLSLATITLAYAQDIAASRAHKTISGADVVKALEILEFGDLVPEFQGELEVFRQSNKSDKGKSKAVIDVKGKGKDKPLSSSSVKLITVPPAADVGQSTSIQEQHSTEKVGTEGVNGAITSQDPPTILKLTEESFNSLLE